SQMLAAEAVASSKTARILRRGAHEEAIAEKRQAAFERDQANAMRLGAGIAQIASSAASTVQAGVKAGTTISEASQPTPPEGDAAAGEPGATSEAEPSERADALADPRGRDGVSDAERAHDYQEEVAKRREDFIKAIQDLVTDQVGERTGDAAGDAGKRGGR